MTADTMVLIKGVPGFREGPELLVDTHSTRETAVLLTHVPERDSQEAWLNRR